MDTLCFSSGGIIGFSFISALKYIIDSGYIDLSKINNFYGTSAGAILCFLLVIDYTPDELISYFNNFDISEMQIEFDFDNIIDKFGLNDGDNIIDLLKFFCKRKLKINNITMKELFYLTKKKLVINTTNYTTGKELIIDYNSCPDLSVFTAIRMSFSIPLIYIPILYNNNYYIDGGFTNNTLIKLCNSKTTFGFQIINTQCNKLESLQDILLNSIHILSERIIPNLDEYNVVIIKQIKCNLFDLDKINIIRILFDLGLSSAKKYHKYQLKKNILQVKYNIINNIINDIITSIENK